MKPMSACICVLLILLFTVPVIADDADQLIGVWERVSWKNLDTGSSNTAPLRLIFTKKYWSISLPNRDGQVELSDPLGGLLDRMIFGSGPYSAKGDQLIRHCDRHTNPRYEGTDFIDKFSFENGLLILLRKTPEGHSIDKRFKRIE